LGFISGGSLFKVRHKGDMHQTTQYQGSQNVIFWQECHAEARNKNHREDVLYVVSVVSGRRLYTAAESVM